MGISLELCNHSMHYDFFHLNYKSSLEVRLLEDE